MHMSALHIFLYKELTLSSESESGLRCQASLLALLVLCTRSLFFSAVPVSYPEFSGFDWLFQGRSLQQN